MDERFYFTYIIASRSRTIYVGVTSDLRRRVFQHKQKTHPGFTARYNCNRLVWFETFHRSERRDPARKGNQGMDTASERSLSLNSANPTWEDLSEPWFPHLAATREWREKQILRSAYPMNLAGSRGPKLLRSG